MPSEVLQLMLNLAAASLPKSLVRKSAQAYGRDGPPVFYV